MAAFFLPVGNGLSVPVSEAISLDSKVAKAENLTKKEASALINWLEKKCYGSINVLPHGEYFTVEWRK